MNKDLRHPYRQGYGRFASAKSDEFAPPKTESVVGKGSTFYVLFPAWQIPALEEEKA